MVMRPISFAFLIVFLAVLVGTPCTQAAPAAGKADFPVKGKVITAISPTREVRG